uniref:Phosphate transporter n=1 Tax=Arcella intermedia TaxID=1963864 RepID=A0A6B2LCT5_9EUKA
MEFTGAVALGQSVAETIRSGISKSDCFADAEAILMLGMMCSLLSAGTWLLIASYFGLPVSTTHSTVGAIIGFTVAAKGWDCVHWGWLEGGKGFAGIALSWIVSPLASGIVAAIIYLLVVIIILKAPNPEKRAFQSIPFIFAGTVAIVTALIFLKSPALKKVKFPEEASWGIVGGLTGICFIVGFFWGTPIMKKFMYLRTKYTSPKSPQYDSLPDENIPLTEENAEPPEDRRAQESAVDNVFVFFQVMTASFESFAHGANDTANAM